MLKRQNISSSENLIEQQPAVIWITGLSGSGKTAISTKLCRILRDMRIVVYNLDGDILRLGLNRDLGFSKEHRGENVRRAAEVAKLFYQAGFVVLCSFVSPYKSGRDYARGLIPYGRFFEVYLECDINECIRRDPKGLYKKALKNLITEFTGISSPYEIPENSNLKINTENMKVEESAYLIVNLLINEGIIPRSL